MTTNPALGTATGAEALSPTNYAFLRQYIQRESGIALAEDKMYLVTSRLTPILREERLGSLDELCTKLRVAPSSSLRRKVIESMTTHETLFFRDPAIFDALRTEFLPEMAKLRESTKTLRIWSAACSSGQEPYTLAMVLLEAGFRDWNIEILGTDLSSRILERAAAGRYLQIEVNRGLPASLLVKYFMRAGLDWQLKDEVRRMVRFAPFDLRQPMRSMGLFDLVLCRNVLIYFDMEARKSILSGIASVLNPGGYLLLGASETTFNLDDRFLRKTMKNTVVYQMPKAGGRS
jgi:chemotaxis protein methyltransferase CheR